MHLADIFNYCWLLLNIEPIVSIILPISILEFALFCEESEFVELLLLLFKFFIKPDKIWSKFPFLILLFIKLPATEAIILLIACAIIGCDIIFDIGIFPLETSADTLSARGLSPSDWIGE